MESFSEVFNIVKNILRENLTEPAYNLWIEPLQAVSLQDNVVTLLSPSAFHCSTIQHNYESRIKDVFDEVMGFDVTLRFISADQPEGEAAAEEAPAPKEPPAERHDEPAAETAAALPETKAEPKPAPQPHSAFDPDGDYEYTFAELYRREPQRVRLYRLPVDRDGQLQRPEALQPAVHLRAVGPGKDPSADGDQVRG